jgi:hypothetical protein
VCRIVVDLLCLYRGALCTLKQILEDLKQFYVVFWVKSSEELCGEEEKTTQHIRRREEGKKISQLLRLGEGEEEIL